MKHLVKFLYLAAVLLLAPSAQADELYTARAIVTGQTAENRAPGIAACFKDVLVKVSGDPRLLDDAAVNALSAQASVYVESYEYLDRMAGVQIHDEQGSRDRSFILTVTFEKSRIDALLTRLGRPPWTDPRPRLAVFLAIRNEARQYMLASDGAFGRDQRDSLEAAAWQMGMTVAIPNEAALAAAGIGFESLAALEPEALDRAAKAGGADMALAGTLVWNKGTLGWAAGWRLTAAGKTHRWRVRDVNFDDAFRSALRGAVQILSGNGEPGK